MIITILLVVAIAAIVKGIERIGATVNANDERARANKRAISMQRARERSQVLADDRAARLMADAARARIYVAGRAA